MSLTSTPTLRKLRAYERSQKGDLFATLEAILFVVVMALLMTALAVGVLTYTRIADTRSTDDRARVANSVVSNGVRYADAVDAVRVGDGPEGPALVLAVNTESGAYETRIYQYQGMLVEEYALQGAAYTPQRATKLVENSRFSFMYSEDGLLEVTTDAGTSATYLHCADGNKR